MIYYLAPMEGLTTYIFRNAFEKYYGGTVKYYSPFLANQTLNSKDTKDVCPENNSTVNLIPQILTNRADVFLDIAKQCADFGYKEVNFNLGCPSGTVTARGRGAGFLNYPVELEAFLDEIYEKCPIDISIKTRIGTEELYEWEDLLKIYAKFPIKELIIHTRLQKEFYKGATHPETFAMAKSALKCPLCYNGDIFDLNSQCILNGIITDSDSIMLGRGILMNPLLAWELQDKPSTRDMKVFWAFHNEILEGYKEVMSGDTPTLFKMKELWTYWISFVQLSDKQLKAIKKSRHLHEYSSVISSIH